MRNRLAILLAGVVSLTSISLLYAEQPKSRTKASVETKHQQNQGPSKAVVVSAIKAYFQGEYKKTPDHKFHATLRPIPMPWDHQYYIAAGPTTPVYTYTVVGGPRVGYSTGVPPININPASRVKDIPVEFIKVNSDGLGSLGTGAYFACVDTKGTDGKIYDIDLLILGNSGTAKVFATAIHKINGKPRYNWKEEGGVWKVVK